MAGIVSRLRRGPCRVPVGVGGGLAVVSAAAAGFGHPAWWLTAVVAAGAVVLAGRRTVLARIPAAGVLVVAVIVVAALVAGFAHVPVLASPAATRMLLAAVSAGVAVVGWTRRRRTVPLADWAEAVAALPAFGLVAAAGYLAYAPLPTAAGWALRGGDNINHLALAADVQHAGWLSYAGEAYPRAFHTLVAAQVTAAGHGPARTPALLDATLRTMAVAEWLTYALFVLAAALTAVRLVRSRRGGTPAAVAGIGSGVVLLSPSFFTFTLGYGFATTVALAALLAVATLEVADGARGTAVEVVVLSAVVMLIIHCWQVGVTAAALLWVVAAARFARRCRHGGSRRVWEVAAAVVSAGLLAAAGPAGWAVVTTMGLAHAAVNGAVDPLPTLPLAAALLVSVAVLAACARRRTRWSAGASVAGAVVVTALTAVAIAEPGGMRLDLYYPRKVFWHAAALGVPLVWTAAAVVLAGPVRRLASAVRRVPIAAGVVPGVVAMAAAVFVWVSSAPPREVVTGGWSGPAAVLPIVENPQAMHATDVWQVGSQRFVDVTAARLLGFYHPGQVWTWPAWVLDAADPSTVCAHLDDAHRRVLSAQPAGQLPLPAACAHTPIRAGWARVTVSDQP